MTEIKTKISAFLILFLFITGCVSTGTKKYPSPPIQEEEEALGKYQKEMLSDEELFSLGLSYLSSPDLNPDYTNALFAFKRLTEDYP
jgi:hypothetical protein